MFFFLLAACGDTDIVISWETPGCEDWDFANPTDPTVEVAWEGTEIDIQRVGMMMTCDTEFDPEIVLDGNQLDIIEGWTDPTEGDCCYSPTVLVREIDLRKLDINWTSLEGQLVYAERAEAP